MEIKRVSPIVLTMVCMASLVFAQTFYDNYYILNIQINHQEKSVDLISFEKRSDGASFFSENGNYQAQLASTKEVLFENNFQTSHIKIVEPTKECSIGEITCDLTPKIRENTIEIIYVPMMESGRYIRILKDRKLKLEVDIENPPGEYIAIKCNDCSPINYLLFLIPLFLIIAITIFLVMRTHHKPEYQQYYER